MVSSPGVPGRHADIGGRRFAWTLAGLVLWAMCAPAAAQNLIANPGFENNPPANCGNNYPYSIAPWIVTGSASPNVVRVDGNQSCQYGNGGPRFDADPATGAGVYQHYLDIAAGSNDFYQSFVVPTCGAAPGQTRQVAFSGYFSTRDNLSGSGAIRIRSGTGISGAVIAQQLVNLPAPPSSATAPWTFVSGTATVTSGSTISYVVSMDNNVNFDQASMTFSSVACVSAPLTLRKTWENAAVNDRATLTATRNASVLDTFVSIADTANETDTDPTPATVFEGETVVLSETLPTSNARTYVSGLACTGGGALSGGTLTVDGSGTAIVCTYTNSGPTADLSITKDNGQTALVAGTTTTYALVARNDASSNTAVSNAIVRDTPSSGLSGCQVLACTPSTGATCPASGSWPGVFTAGGLAIGALPAGGQVEFQVQCNVD